MLKELDKKEMQIVRGGGPVATGVGIAVGIAIIVLAGRSKSK